MKYLKYTLALFVLMSTLNLGYAQTKENPAETEPVAKGDDIAKETKKANDYFEAKEYYVAAEIYKKAFSKAKSRKEKTDITFNLAECYRFMNDCKSAAAQYKRALKMKADPIAQLRYADMLRCQGEYEEAIVEYQIYKQEKPSDKRGEEGILASKAAIEWMKKPSRYAVNNMKDMNSKGSDYQVAFAGKRKDDYSVLYLSSMREESTGKREDGWTGQRYSDIYSMEAERKKAKGGRQPKGAVAVEEVKYSTPVPLSEVINTDNHEGTLCFDSRMKTMYFTRCSDIKRMKLGCAIYETKKLGADWAAPEQVVLADSASSVGHPSLSPDDQILYFSGDIAGTLGGKDLWLTTYDRRARKWNAPTNLGPKINTEGDEVFPFAHDDGYLYFSSNGLPGMGGLDIFRIKTDKEGMPVGDPENMQFPINSNNDDFAIMFEAGDSKKGFLASDRKGGKGSDDIYSVYLVPLKFNMNGVVVSAKDGKPVPQATVRLDGTDGTSIVVNTDKDGNFTFDKDKLNEDTQYKINVEKKKFLNNTADFTTTGVELSAFEFVPSENIFLHGMSITVKLDPIEVPIVLPNIQYATAKWDLRPEAMLALDSVVSILNNNPNITIELRSHTDYTDTDERNRILSKKRADTCVSYLVSKGIDAERLTARGMGEDEPYVIPDGYKGLGAAEFSVGTKLTEQYIKSQSQAKQETANQINRRTDMKILRDDYVPDPNKPKTVVPGSTTPEKKAEEEKEAVVPIGDFYTCTTGDNFAKIAKVNNISIVDLKKLNGGLRGVRVFEGLMLKVTPGGDYTQWDEENYQVSLNESLSDIAKKVNLSEKELRDMNNGIKDKDLLPGMWLKIK